MVRLVCFVWRRDNCTSNPPKKAPLTERDRDMAARRENTARNHYTLIAMTKATIDLHLARLRDVGWDVWDPIGLRTILGPWRDSSAEDEYDCYLLEAAERLKRLDPLSEIAEYLVAIEVEHMGLRPGASTFPRALAAVEAIKSYLATIA